LFGQTGKAIGVNFGVFTENTAANMAIPIKFAIELLNKAGWQQPEATPLQNANSQTTNVATTGSPQPKNP